MHLPSFTIVYSVSFPQSTHECILPVEHVPLAAVQELPVHGKAGNSRSVVALSLTETIEVAAFSDRAIALKQETKVMTPK